MDLTNSPCVLIVDDEPQNRQLLRAMLHGYRVLEAESGREALELVEKERVDLVLLDVMMPGLSGYSTCSAIKARAGASFLPVVFVTALSELDHRNLGWQAGADDFLTKPIDRQELQHRVRALLRLRAQEGLIHQQLSQLQSLQTLKDEMIALLVHDLRAPLCGLIAYLNLLLDETTGLSQEDVRAALDAADAIRIALEDMLQVRLLEERKLPVAPAPVDLRELVTGVAALLGPVARRRKVLLTTSVEGEPRALIDGKLTRRAVENLVLNAIRYTREGGDVELRARVEGNNVSFEVADRGPGIPAELRKHLFEKFSSVEAQAGGARTGFGLGLYLVKLVCEGHGGAPEILDRPGGGALFRMHLLA